MVLLGPNGAGKTTLLRILATLTKHDAGSVTVNGFDAAAQGELVRQTTGAVLHSHMLYADLTARENLRFFARLCRISDPERRILEAAERMQVAHRLDDRVRSLSHGLAKRVALARALLHAPRLLLLDEAEAGLDQPALKLLDGVLDEHKRDGRAVVMTTHQVERGLEQADRVVVISHGRVVLDRPRSEVTNGEVTVALGVSGELTA